MRYTIAVSVFVLLGSAVQGDESSNGGYAQTIAPFVDDQTFLVAHVDVSRVNIDLIVKHLEKLGLEQGATAKGLAVLATTTFLKSGGKDIYLFMNWANPVEDFLVAAPLAKDASSVALGALVGQIPGMSSEVNNNTLLVGSKKALARFKNFHAGPAPVFDKAFAIVGDGSAQIILVPPVALKRALKELNPNLPKEIGGSTSELDFSWAGLSMDLKDALGAKLVIKAADPSGAEKLEKTAQRALAFAGQCEEVKQAFPDFGKLTSVLTPKVDGDQLIFTLKEDQFANVLLPLVAKQRQAAKRAMSTNKLKQMALAMHNYMDVNRSFPPAASHDKDGKPLLSWRVLILPYIEQNQLYQEFHLNEPWDSEHNKKLLPRMPAVYRSPASKLEGKGLTTYLVPVGPKTIFGGKKGIPIQKVTDGTSNTILILEADDSRAVNWTQPEDYKVDAKNPLAGLVRPGSRGFNAAFADGSVHLFADTIPTATLRAMYTANGGEPIDWPK